MAPGLLAAAAVLAAVASLAAHVALNCPVQPMPSIPRPPTPPPNNLLQRLEKLGEGLLDAPEDVHVDAVAGEALYTATSDGWLQRMHPNNGSWERWRFVGGTGLLGIAPSAHGTMLVCDADKGLLRVGEQGVALLASEVEGTPISCCATTCSNMQCSSVADNPSLILLTMRVTGPALPFRRQIRGRGDRGLRRYGLLQRCQHQVRLRQVVLRLLGVPRHRPPLLRYDPRDGETSLVLDRLSCANGVALPRDETFVVVCETGRFRCMKVWLRGEKAETFVDNLPGSPDNIRLGSDGHYWIALHVSLPATAIRLGSDGHYWIALHLMRSPWLDFVTRWTFTKRVVASFPALVEWSKGTTKGAMVAQVSEDGNIVRLLDDYEGKVINSVTSVTEFNGDIFLGSVATNFIGKLSLAQVA